MKVFLAFLNVLFSLAILILPCIFWNPAAWFLSWAPALMSFIYIDEKLSHL